MLSLHSSLVLDGCAKSDNSEGHDHPIGTPGLTDGFHVFVDALKLNGVDTIYGLVGIPITDLARLAQKSGNPLHRFPARDLRRQRRGRGRVSDSPARRVLDGLGARFSQRPGRAGERHDELFPDDPDLRVERAPDCGHATGRLRGTRSARRGPTVREGGIPDRARRGHRRLVSPVPFAPPSPDGPAASIWTSRVLCSPKTIDAQAAANTIWRVIDPDPPQLPAPEAVDRAVQLLAQARRPLIVIGKGCGICAGRQRHSEVRGDHRHSVSCRCRWPRGCCPTPTHSPSQRRAHWRWPAPTW